MPLKYRRKTRLFGGWLGFLLLFFLFLFFVFFWGGTFFFGGRGLGIYGEALKLFMAVGFLFLVFPLMLAE